MFRLKSDKSPLCFAGAELCHCALCCDPEPLFTSIPHDPCKLGHPLSVMKNVSMVIVSRLLLVPLEVLDPAMMRSCNLLPTPTFVILVQSVSLFPCTKSGLKSTVHFEFEKCDGRNLCFYVVTVTM